MARRIKVFFDGGCRPNPGAMEIAVVAAGKAHVIRGAGQGTSMDAEWLALIQALRIARKLGGDFVLVGDAAAVIDVANGSTRCRASAARHLAEFNLLVGAGERPALRYVKRSQNLAGIALAAFHPR